MDPISLMLFGGTALSAGVNLFGGFKQAQAERFQGQYQKLQYDMNAWLSEFSAKDSLKRGDKEASQYRNTIRQTIGSQRAAAAAQGITVDTGSIGDIQDETATIGENNYLNIKNNAWREAFGFRFQADQYRSAGRMAELGANSKAGMTMMTAGLSSFNDVLGGAYKYYDRNRPKEDAPKKDEQYTGWPGANRRKY